MDTFNTTLNNHTDVATVVSRAKAAGANAIFAQVRRRGDAWYVTPLEPKFANIAAGFDPLADLVNEAHANGIEVHAFVIMGAIWTSAAAPPNVTLPTSPLHAFNQHGGYDPVTRTVVPGPNNWLTRTLLADGGGITFQGHRFGNDFWLDFGHPDAAAFTVDVMMHLVRNYNIDGLHLDRIRYPEFAAAGQTPANGTNIGYNPTNVERFNARHNRTGTPATGDPLWMQWRRDQVSNVVRRVYLNAVAEKPQPENLRRAHRLRRRPRVRAGAELPDRPRRVAQRRSLLARLSGLARVDRGGHPRPRRPDELQARAPRRAGHAVRAVEQLAQGSPVRPRGADRPRRLHQPD